MKSYNSILKIFTLLSIMVSFSVQNLVCVMATPSTSIEDKKIEGFNDILGSDIDRNNLSYENLQKVIYSIQEYDNAIENKMQRLDELIKKLEENQNNLDKNKENISLLEEDMKEKDKMLGERLKNIQETGGKNATLIEYIGVLLDSGNFLDIVNRMNMINKVCENDVKVINEAKKAKKKLEDAKKEIEKEKKRNEEDKNYIDEQLKKLDEDKKKLNDYIKRYSDEFKIDGSLKPIRVSDDVDELTKEIINEAQKYLGVPYLWGGTTPYGFDCSGLMQYAYASQGIDIPRTSQEQQKACEKIDTSDLMPGDLVFNKDSNSTHVGMYLGDDKYIQAPHTGDFIKISTLSTSNMKYAGRVKK